MLKPEERNAFLYETRNLAPYKRKEMIIDYISKAKALCEQELITELYRTTGEEVIGWLAEKKERQAGTGCLLQSGKTLCKTTTRRQ